MILRFCFIAALFLCSANALASSVIEVPIDGDTRFWFSAFSLAATEAKAQQEGGGQTTSYNYVSMNYATDYDSHFALRVPFLYNTAGFNNFNQDENQKQGLNLGDVLLDYTVNAFLLPGDIEVFSRYRLELPTSKFSLAQKKIAGLRFDAIATRNINRGLYLEYWPIATWNIHTQTVYENPDGGFLSHTKRYEFDHRMTLWYRANQKFYFGFYVGGEDVWYNESDVNTTGRVRDNRFSEHLLKVGPSIRYTLNSHLTFLFNLQNGVPLWGYQAERAGQVSDLGQFKPEHTQFVLLSFIAF